MERRPSPRRVPPSPASRGRAGAAGRAPMRLILVPAAITLGVTLLRLRGGRRRGRPPPPLPASCPALGQLLVAYAVAARIPVAVVMLFAILAGWGTHYDAPPPVFPAMLPLRRWLWTGLLPQAP